MGDRSWSRTALRASGSAPYLARARMRISAPGRPRSEILDPCSSGAHASWESSSACSTRRRRGAAGPCWSRVRRASARRGSPPRSRRALATADSPSWSAARSTSSAPSCRTNRSSKRSVRSRARPARSCVCSRPRWRGSPIDADPVLLVLEDLHWADTSTLDLVVFLAHNLADQRVVLLGTYRESLGRFVESVRRSERALIARARPALARGRDRAARRRPRCERDRHPLGRQSILRRGAARGRRRAAGKPARRAAPARERTRPRTCCG